MHAFDLPEPIAAYFAAATRDGDAVARCFTNDGRVVDDGETLGGHAAIAHWHDAATKRYAAIATPFAMEDDGRAPVVICAVNGDFPGSPVNLRFAFVLERGKIASLAIAP